MMTSATATNQSPLRVAGLIASDIKLHHSVFAMPFAILAAFMAALGPTHGTYFVSRDAESSKMGNYAHPYLHPDYASQFWPQFAGQLALIMLAMIFARTVAMLANRLLDREIDKVNPRTAGRAIPSGRLSPQAALRALLVSAAAFMLTCAGFGLLDENWWPLALSVPVLAWISAYPLLKRFTALCHLYLGSSLAISPLAAAIAIDPDSLANQPALWLLSAMVLCWVAGFDIIYALQDVQIDRREALHSIPARLGAPGALWISRLLHALAFACIYASWAIDPRFGIVFAIGVGIVGALLVVEHVCVARWSTTRLTLAFFTINGLISCAVGALGVIDVAFI